MRDCTKCDDRMFYRDLREEMYPRQEWLCLRCMELYVQPLPYPENVDIDVGFTDVGE